MCFFRCHYFAILGFRFSDILEFDESYQAQGGNTQGALKVGMSDSFHPLCRSWRTENLVIQLSARRSPLTKMQKMSHVGQMSDKFLHFVAMADKKWTQCRMSAALGGAPSREGAFPTHPSSSSNSVTMNVKK